MALTKNYDYLTDFFRRNMDVYSSLLVVFGLALFEIIISVDNAIINAEVLGTMSKKARRWFLVWGILKI